MGERGQAQGRLKSVERNELTVALETRQHNVFYSVRTNGARCGSD